jgi:fluoroquinolone transport system ATP-binding protein
MPARYFTDPSVSIESGAMITVDKLSFSYKGGHKEAISGLSFEIGQSEIFGFLGPSGAGKSTTQKILIRLLRQYQGSVSVFDRKLTDWGPDYFERIGVSFEFPTHFLKLTATENLIYFARLYRAQGPKSSALLESVGLSEDAGLPVAQYSKGMKNRLSFARALLNNPEILFLDEPTAGLDPVSSRRIRDLIKAQKAAGKTVFLTTHDMTLADELCDRVAFIVGGRIEIIGRPRDLRLRYGQAKILVGYQMGNHEEHREFALAGLADNVEFLDFLRTHAVQTIHSQEASLEDVFIRVTGHALS